MKPLNAWMRDLHLYLGLFVCPALLIFGVSTLLLNHPELAGRAPASTATLPVPRIPIEVPDGMGTLAQAKGILRQLKLTGEIDYIRHDAKNDRLLIPVTKPGQSIMVEVDLRSNTASVERRDQGLAGTLIYLHKMPGPHNAKLRGNWVCTVWWGLMADTVVCGILFLTVSGVYLWWRIRPERTIGWGLLGAGLLSTTALVAALCMG